MTSKIEELAAKAVGVAKEVKARFEGFSGVFSHLVREHGEVSALLMRLELSSDPDVRRELWPAIRKELLGHERGEIAVVYPSLQQNAETRVMVAEHNHDAAGLEDAIEELTLTPVTSEQWQPNLRRLIALVQEHVRDEEEEYFPIADQVFRDRSDALLERFEEAKREAIRQLDGGR
jgi:hypothetical protein